MILIVGGADTGRAPMAVTILQSLLANQEIESAGVLGHDQDTWQDEARLALQHLGYTPHKHVARSINKELLDQAKLILTIDRGVNRAMELQFAITTYSLPDLAQSPHEVMDPFRMTLDAWVIYARQLENQLKAALPRIKQLLGGQVLEADAKEAKAAPVAPLQATSEESKAPVPALQRLMRLIDGIAGLPEVIDWRKARKMMRDTLQTFTSSLNEPGDLRPAAVSMLLGVLGEHDQPLSSQHIELLHAFVEALQQPIDQNKLGELGGLVGRWNT